VAVIIDHTNGRVLEVLKSREKQVVRQYLERGRADGTLAQVREVTTDMWDGYVQAAREALGERVRITIDRFHVMKNFQDHLTAARREIQRLLPKEDANALKGTRWLWLTNEENLTEEGRAVLAALQERFPLLKQLREQREKLRRLFEDPALTTAAAGAKQLRAWMKEARALGLKALDAFCKTLDNWLHKIANYFVDRASNGRVEGFNTGLRGILWRAFGMFNFDHFRLRVLDRFGRPKPC
jgi:transposase